MVTLIISAVVGVFLPALVALVTKENLSGTWKAVILALLSAATGVLTSVSGSPPSGWNGWEHVGVGILVAFVAAVQSQFGVAEIHAAIARATKHSGIGPSPTPNG